MKKTALTPLLVIGLLTGLLSACGGGGGGGGSSSGNGSGGSNPGPASMIPAAPALGQTLFEDATVLRPVQDGMRWIYDGKYGPSIYSSDVRIASEPTGLQETAWNVFGDGSDISGIKIENGTVTLTELVNFGASGLTETLATTELRSPVRVGDQYTALERNGLALNQDIDNDRVNDKADVAGWSRVIGLEDVDLPALQRTVSAVRVDNTIAIRIQRSSDKRYEATQWITQSTWYARDIGIVRRTLSAPGTGAAGAVEYDERLRAWDGLTRGLGALLHARPAQPASSYTAYPALKALAVGDRALVLSGLSDDRGEQGLRLTVYDRSGRFLKTVPLPVSKVAVNNQPQFVNCGAQACLLTVSSDVFGALSAPLLMRFDKEGTAQGPVDGIAVTLGGFGASNHLATGDANGLWVMWLARTAPPGGSGPVELRLQAFASDGSPRFTHQVLEPGSLFTTATPLSLSSNGVRVTATWRWPVFPRYQYKYATVTAGTAATTKLMHDSQSPAPGNSFQLRALNVDDDNLALFWPGTLFSNSNPSSSSWRGLQLNNGTGPVRSTTDSPDNELLPSSWIMDGYSPMFAAHSGAVFMLSQGVGKLSADSVSDSELLQLIQITPGSAALASAQPIRTLVPANDSYIPFTFRASQMLAFEDRVLIFGTSTNTVGVAFRR
ncbi:MAG TPA: hypothetical protein VGE47_06300 [Burkholderiaceae bacterium]